MRFQTEPSKRMTNLISNWASPPLHLQIQNLLKSFMKHQDFNLEFVRLKSLPGAPAQDVHCDNDDEGL